MFARILMCSVCVCVCVCVCVYVRYAHTSKLVNLLHHVQPLFEPLSSSVH